MFGIPRIASKSPLPAMTHLTITRSGGDGSPARNGVSVASQDGRIYLTDITGSVTAHSDSGRIVATNVSANVIDLKLERGRIETSQLEAYRINTAPHCTPIGPLADFGCISKYRQVRSLNQRWSRRLGVRSGSDAMIDVDRETVT